jgi:NAD(P)H-nitrite reductase large subunit
MSRDKIDNLKSDYIVCKCYEVSFGDIIEAIEDGYNTVDSLMHETHAGYGCERCHSKLDDAENDREIHLDEILKYYNK